MTDFWVNNTNTFSLGDAFAALEAMPARSVDLLFTSPPDISETSPPCDEDVASYTDFLIRACTQFQRVIKDTGFVAVAVSDRRLNAQMLPKHTVYIEQLRTRHGMQLKDEKIVCMRTPVDRVDVFRPTFQYLSVFTRRGKIKRKGPWLPDVYVDDQQPQHGGTTVWTPQFCTLVVETLSKPGQLVVDPFAAAAPVLVAARAAGRTYFGTETDAALHDAGRQQLSTVQLDVVPATE